LWWSACCAYVSIRQRMSASGSLQHRCGCGAAHAAHTSAYVSIRQHTSAYVSVCQLQVVCNIGAVVVQRMLRIRQHTSAYVSVCQLTSAYVSMLNLACTSGIESACSGYPVRMLTYACTIALQHALTRVRYRKRMLRVSGAYADVCVYDSITACAHARVV
jgi:hypothetical protein